jgi:cytochrome c peroxidase
MGSRTRLLSIVLVVGLAAACSEGPKSSERAAEVAVMQLSREPILPLPPAAQIAPTLAALGERLYHDPRLSADGTVACASCHVIESGGDDGRQTSLGIRQQLGDVNAPTVLNSALNFVQFWNGRAASLEEQAGGPIENPKEMGNTWSNVLRTLRADPSYVRQFAEAFPEARAGTREQNPDAISEANVRSAIAGFERTLATPGARFDRWLTGDKAALSADERAGYELFKSVGCVACHQGRNVGGNMFQRFGVFGNYLEQRGNLREADLGRFAVTGKEADRFVFRVPSLRNVELTAPYFHDGSAATLEDAVRVMARVQLGRPLADDDVKRVVLFLKTLTGKLPKLRGEYAAATPRKTP